MADLRPCSSGGMASRGVPVPQVDHPHAHARRDQTERVLQCFGEAQRLFRAGALPPRTRRARRGTSQVGRAHRHLRRRAGATEEAPAASRAPRTSRSVIGGLPIVASVVLDATQRGSLEPQQAVIGRLCDGAGAIDRFLRSVGVAQHPETGAEKEGDHPDRASSPSRSANDSASRTCSIPLSPRRAARWRCGVRGGRRSPALRRGGSRGDARAP